MALASCGGGGAKGCPAGGSGAEPAPRQVAVDAGVPLEDFHALAVARCNYWGRCSGLATYVVNECVDSLTNGTGWAYQICAAAPAVKLATSYFFYAYPSAALLAAAGGAAHYDPAGAGRCIAALLAEGCADRQLVEELRLRRRIHLPVRRRRRRAPPGRRRRGRRPRDPLADTAPFTTCATDADCVGLTAYPQGPHCVGGLCVAYPCGIPGYGCTSFAQTGDPCDSNAPSLDSNQTLTATATCAPGLACVGAGVDDGGRQLRRPSGRRRRVRPFVHVQAGARLRRRLRDSPPAPGRASTASAKSAWPTATSRPTSAVPSTVSAGTAATTPSTRAAPDSAAASGTC